MKLASFLSRHNALLSIGSLVLSLLLLIGAAFTSSEAFKQVMTALAFIFLVLIFVFAFGGYFLYSIRNADLRRNGKPATATVLASKWTGGADSRGRNISRFKLEVHPPDEAAFVAVVEDSYFQWEFHTGQQVAVRYDPRTKEVALEKIKRPKQDNF